MPFFELGGMIYETTYRGTTKGLDNLPRVRSRPTITTSSSVRATIIAPKENEVQQSTETTTFKEDFVQGLSDEADWLKIRAGSTAVGTGVKIARAAAIVAMADGPLPVGDVIAAGILIGGGIYLLGSGMDWW